MKAITIFLLLLFTFSNSEAQEGLQEQIELDEATITYTYKINFSSNVEGYEFDVKEDYKGQFAENPVKFCDENIDIQSLIDFVDSDEYDQYEIVLTNRKGSISAVYNKEGELVKTRQKFRDVALPDDIRRQLFRDHEGWAMTSNKYVAIGKGNQVHKEKYRIEMQKGKDSKNVRLKRGN